MPRFAALIVSTATLCSQISALPCAAEDWPQFRGPQANGLTIETTGPLTWNADTNIQWKVSVPGSGWSAPIVSGGKIIVTTAVSVGEQRQTSEENEEAEEPVHRFEVHCFDLATGQPLWHRVATEGKPRFKKHRDNTFASETPVTDGQRIIVYFGMTGLFCYDFAGQLLWHKDLGVYEMQGEWGTSASPAMHDGLVFIQNDSENESFLVALDATSGEERWRVAREEKSTWCSPIIWKNKQRTELVTGGKVIRSYNPQTGGLLWQLTAGERASSASPAGNEEMLVVGARGLFAVRAGAAGDITPATGETSSSGVLWSHDRGGPQMASPLIHDGFVYICDRRGGIVTCYDAATGKEAYKERLPGEREFWASPWACGDRIFCLDDSGATHVLAPGAEFKVLTTNQLEGRFWASSAVTDGSFLLRSTDSLYRISERPRVIQAARPESAPTSRR
jgi:outer membrane protein assembly factor BamB